MLLHVLRYDNAHGIAHAIEASRYQGEQTPSGAVVLVYSDPKKQRLEAGQTYSFLPTTEFVGDYFVHGELDYTSPGIK